MAASTESHGQETTHIAADLDKMSLNPAEPVAQNQSQPEEDDVLPLDPLYKLCMRSQYQPRDSST